MEIEINQEQQSQQIKHDEVEYKEDKLPKPKKPSLSKLYKKEMSINEL